MSTSEYNFKFSDSFYALRPLLWQNNVTRLNQSNMNTIKEALDVYKTEFDNLNDAITTTFNDVLSDIEAIGTSQSEILEQISPLEEAMTELRSDMDGIESVYTPTGVNFTSNTFSIGTQSSGKTINIGKTANNNIGVSIDSTNFITNLDTRINGNLTVPNNSSFGNIEVTNTSTFKDVSITGYVVSPTSFKEGLTVRTSLNNRDIFSVGNETINGSLTEVIDHNALTRVFGKFEVYSEVGAFNRGLSVLGKIKNSSGQETANTLAVAGRTFSKSLYVFDSGQEFLSDGYTAYIHGKTMLKGDTDIDGALSVIGVNTNSVKAYSFVDSHNNIVTNFKDLEYPAEILKNLGSNFISYVEVFTDKTVIEKDVSAPNPTKVKMYIDIESDSTQSNVLKLILNDVEYILGDPMLNNRITGYIEIYRSSINFNFNNTNIGMAAIGQADVPSEISNFGISSELTVSGNVTVEEVYRNEIVGTTADGLEITTIGE